MIELLRPIRVAFDDGPLDTTEAILDILFEHDVQATFFVVGELIAARENTLRRMIDEGHEVGNHSWSHVRLASANAATIRSQIKRGHDAIESVTEVAPVRFRPPFRASSPRVEEIAKELGYLEVCATSSLGDYAMSHDLIVAAASSAPVLWLHDGVPATVEALPAILAARA